MNYVITPHDKVGSTTPDYPFLQSKFTFQDVYTAFLDEQVRIKRAKDLLQECLKGESLTQHDRALLAEISSAPINQQDHAEEEKRLLQEQHVTSEPLPKHIQEKLRLCQKMPKNSSSLHVSQRKTVQHIFAASVWEDFEKGQINSAKTALLNLETALNRAEYANSVRAFAAFIRYVLCGDVVTMEDTIDEYNVVSLVYYLSALEAKANATITGMVHHITKILSTYGVEEFLITTIKGSLDQFKFLFPEG